MAIPIRFAYPTKGDLGFSVERMADGLHLDFATMTFSPSPVSWTNAMAEMPWPFLGQYVATLKTTPPAEYPDGEYAIGIHDLGNNALVVAMFGETLRGGEPASVFPATLSFSLGIATVKT